MRAFGQDRRLGYLLCVSDLAVLLPLLVWTSSPLVQTALIILWAAGLAVSCVADQAQRRAAAQASRPQVLSPGGQRGQAGLGAARGASGQAEALLRHLERRIRLFQASGERFALVMLRVLRLTEFQIYYGPEEVGRMLSALERRGLRVLAPDARCFSLAGGRIAFVFALGEAGSLARAPGTGPAARAPHTSVYDVEGLAMTLARLVCERSVHGHRVACSVGWASCPADGITAEDLLYVAETGAKSTDVFRQVGSAPVAAARPRRAAG